MGLGHVFTSGPRFGRRRHRGIDRRAWKPPLGYCCRWARGQLFHALQCDSGGNCIGTRPEISLRLAQDTRSRWPWFLLHRRPRGRLPIFVRTTEAGAWHFRYVAAFAFNPCPIHPINSCCGNCDGVIFTYSCRQRLGRDPLTVSWSASTLGIATGVSLSGGYKPAMASEIRGWGARQTNHGGSEDVD